VIRTLEDHRIDDGNFDDGNLFRYKIFISLIVALKSILMKFALLQPNFFH